MIVTEAGTDWLLVTQNDHAALAADLLGAWRELARLRERELLLRATRLHDNGWRETDSAPRVDPGGAPQDFLTVPAGERRRLWERGMDRYRTTDPPCALLIAEHAIWLHRDSVGDSELAALLASARARREELLAEVPRGQNLADELYPWLRLADDLSLRSCWGRMGRFAVDQPDGVPLLQGSLEPGTERRESRVGAGPGSLASVLWKLGISPFPLAGTTTFSVRCRRIPRRPYRDDTDLGTSLAQARWEALLVQAAPESRAEGIGDGAAPGAAGGRSGAAC